MTDVDLKVRFSALASSARVMIDDCDCDIIIIIIFVSVSVYAFNVVFVVGIPRVSVASWRDLSIETRQAKPIGLAQPGRSPATIRRPFL